MNVGNKGFTLIELLIVVAIIGVLAGTVLPALGNARKKVSNTLLRAELSKFKNKASLYYGENNSSFDNMFVSNNTWDSTDSDIKASLINIDKHSSVYFVGSSDSAWALQVRSVYDVNLYLCIDHDSELIENYTIMSPGTTSCPPATPLI
jgi:prepilin-type N-terminal cleavage/methylation domain-containing protein